MRFTYCPHCGGKLIRKEIGDEGLVPYCEACRVPLWDAVTPCVICAVVNEQREVALIRQSYGRQDRFVCVAGFMKIGESAEDAAKREIKEEIGLNVQNLCYIGSYPYEQKDMLMLGFKAFVQKNTFALSGEVADACWMPFEEALLNLSESKIAYKLVKAVTEEANADV